MRNGDWARGRDRLADSAYHSLLELLVGSSGRVLPPTVAIVLDREWLSLLPASVLTSVKFDGSTFSLQISTLAEMEEMLGKQKAEHRAQAGDAANVYVLEKRAGGRRKESMWFHIYLPAHLHYAPGAGTGDVSHMRCHVARIHRGNTLWSTLDA